MVQVSNSILSNSTNLLSFTKLISSVMIILVHLEGYSAIRGLNFVPFDSSGIYPSCQFYWLFWRSYSWFKARSMGLLALD